MNSHMPNPGIATATLVLLMLVGCAATPTPDGASAVRAKLTELQSDPQLAGHAPVAFKDAESAVRQAEVPTDDTALGRHRVAMAERKVEIARAEAQSHFAEDQRKSLAGQRDAARLDSRTREADNARADANIARGEADAARVEADSARNDADSAREEAHSARLDTAAAEQDTAALQKHIAELNAKATDRGLVVTLGDVLFTSGASDLKSGTQGNLTKLSAFLNKYADRTVVIEGHTDSVGSADSNLGLSQRRADAVKSYLVGKGVASGRLTAAGKGEDSPAAGNDSASGRQQNRRVEVIISNEVASLR